MGLNSLGGTDWVPIFEDAASLVFMFNRVTGAVREGPWIVLRDPDGLPFFVNLVSRVTRWLPPHRWMEGWISRDSSAWSGHQFYTRSLLPRDIARLRVEGGAPYLDACGRPQYAPDGTDTLRSYPQVALARCLPVMAVA